MALVCNTDGVPLMAPVLELKVKPVGKVGLICHVVTDPPFTLGVLVLIAVPLVRVMFSGE